MSRPSSDFSHAELLRMISLLRGQLYTALFLVQDLQKSGVAIKIDSDGYVYDLVAEIEDISEILKETALDVTLEDITAIHSLPKKE